MTKQKQKIRKSGKRLLAGILCAAMMFGEFGLAASAEEIHITGEPTVVTESGEPMTVTEPGADQPMVTTEPETDQPVVTTEPEAEQSATVTEPGENVPETTVPETDGAAGSETVPETTPTEPSTPEENTPGAGDTAGNETTPADPSVPEGNAPGAGDTAGNETTPVTPSTPEENAPETETPDTEKPEEEKPETDTEETDEENPEDEKEKEEKEEADEEDKEATKFLKDSGAKDLESLSQEVAFQKMYKSIFGEEYSEDNTEILYVAGTRPTESSHKEGTKENPYTSLTGAYDKASKNSIIYLMGDYTSDGESYSGYNEEEALRTGWVVGDKPVIITADSGVGIPMYTSWNLGGNTGFYNLSIRLKYGANQNEEIFCNGNTVVIGGEGKNNIQMVLEDGTTFYPTLFGGSGDTTVEKTNLTVNGGTYNRIYGGGSYSSVVTGEAKLTVNGRVDGEENNCSVSIITNHKNNSEFTNEYKDLDNIVGGGATNASGSFGAVGSTSLTIDSLHQNGNRAYRIGPSGGNVTAGDAVLTVTNSKLSNIYRGYGPTAKNIYYDVTDSSVGTISFAQQSTGAGLTDNAELSVKCENSTVDNFFGRQANASGSTESAIYGISQNMEFRNCKLKTFSIFGNYNGEGGTDTCILDNCSFSTGGYFYGTYVPKKLILEFRNMKQKIVFCKDTTEAKKNTVEEKTIGAYQSDYNPVNKRTVAVKLENTAAEDSLESRTWNELSLLQGAAFSGHNLTLDKISGTGILRLADGATGSFGDVGEGTSIAFGAWGEVKDKCTIIAQYGSDGGKEFYKEEDSDLFYKAIPGSKVSFWYLSAEIIQDDTNKCIYVDQASHEEGDGSFANPFRTLESAYKAATPERNQIVLVSEYVLNGDLPKADNMDENSIVLSAKDSTNDFSQYAKLILKNEELKKETKVNIQNNTIFQNIKIAPSLAGINYLNTHIYANGYRLEIGEGATGDGLISLLGENSEGKEVTRVQMKVQSGSWARIGIVNGKIGNENNLPEGEISNEFIKNVNSENVVNIEIKNADCNLILLEGTFYGSVLLTRDGGRNHDTTLNAGGTVYGDMSVVYKGSLGASSYGDILQGTYYGKVSYSTLEAEKCHYYYSVALQGTYYQGAEVLIGKNTTFGNNGGINLVGNNGIKAYAPIVYEVEREASVSSVYAAGAEKAVFYDEGCIQLNIPTSPYLTTAASRDVIASYQNKIYEKFYLTLKGEAGAASNIENCYGFETITIEKDAKVVVGSPLYTETLSIGEGAKLSGREIVTIGNAEEENGILEISGGSRLELQKPVYVNGTAQGSKEGTNPGVLVLNNELYADDSDDTPGSYSQITRAVSGKIALFTTLPYGEQGGQKLYLKDKNAKDAFVPENDSVCVVTEEKNGYLVHRFGNIKDYSVIYVDGNSGDDTREGLQSDQAVKTLERAYELITNGGTILISGPVTVEAWPQNSIRSVKITSCNYTSTQDTTDYRTTNQAVLTLPKNVVLKADTNFACVAVKGMTDLNAAGYAVIFGVENALLPEGIANFSCGKTNVTGSNETYAYPTSITIHSGTFAYINPWTNDQRAKRGEQDKEIISLTMTGGVADKLGVGSYVCPVGKANYHLTGGKVKQLGSSSLTNYASSDFEEEYDIRDNFIYDTFYATDTSITSGNITVRMTDVKEKLPMLSYGNQREGIIKKNYKLYLENTTIEKVYGGKSNQTAPEVNTGQVDIHLGENAVIENLYCGSQGTVENLKKVSVFLEDGSADIGNLYPYGLSGTLGAEDISMYAINSGEEAVPIDFLRGKIDTLQIGNEKSRGRVNISKDSAAFIDLLQVQGGSTAEIDKGAVFAGDYRGAETKESPAIFQLSNASITEFKGKVSGYTQVNPKTESGFKNGLTIDGGTCSEVYAKDMFFTEENNEESLLLEYDAKEIKWTLPDVEEDGRRNTVYVSEVGTDNAAGSFGAPVATIGKAYEKAAELYQSISQNTDLGITEEEKRELLKGINICVLDSVNIGQNAEIITVPDFKHVTVHGENEDANIVFEDGNAEFDIPMSTDFKNIMFEDTCHLDSPAIYAQGYTVRLEETVTTAHEQAAGGRYLTIYGGAKDKKVESTNLTVLGGCFHSVYGGGDSGSVIGDVTLHVGSNILVGTDISGEYNSEYSVYGGGNKKEATVQGNVKLTVDGGNYWGIRGGGHYAPVKGNVNIAFNSGKTHALYGGGVADVATVQNTSVFIGTQDGKEKATVTGFFRGSGERGGLTSESGKTTVTIYDNANIESGTEFCAGGYAGNVGSTSLNVKGGVINTDIYGGGWGVASSKDYGLILQNTNVTLEGGTITGNVFAGGNNGLVNGKAVLSLNDGKLQGNLYGGGNAAGVHESEVNIQLSETAEQQGNIFGGSYNIEVKDKDIQESSLVTFVEGSVNGNVFGGSDTAGKIGKAEVAVQGNVSVTGGVFGGGCQAPLETDTHVIVEEQAVLNGNVYGGGQGIAEDGGIGTSIKNVFRSGVNLLLDLFDKESSFALDGLEDANVPKTNVEIQGTVIGNAYGGGELATVGVEANGDGAAETKAAGDGSTVAPATNVVIADGASVTGNIYGGGKGRDGRDFAKIYGETSVKMKGGTVQQEVADNPVGGCIFGGGEIAPVGGNTNVMVSAGTVHNVFGGNDQSGQISGDTNVTITATAGQDGTEAANTANTTKVTNVYGGGRDAAYGVDATKDAAEVSTNVVINGGTVENAYGGGFGASAVCQNTSLTINGGYTEMAFAGGNAATVDGKAELTVNVPQTGGRGSEEATDADQPVANTDETALYAGADVDTEDNTDVNTDVFEGTADVQTVFAGNNQAAMNIQPTIHLQSGKIDTFYGGGNQGNMTKEDGISYGEDTFGSDEIFINTVYGGCNSADVIHGVTLELSKGTYGEVYGGNNVDGEAHQSQVILNGDTLEVNTVYGGGNQASIENASVTALKGKIQTIYGGGNSATATESVSLAVGQKPGEATSGSAERTAEATAEGTAGDTAGSTAENVVGNAVITNLYCGNNQAVMNIAPTIDMQKGTVTNFFGGGNRGAMEPKENESLELKYIFDSDEMEITNLYGGGNQADVEGEIALTLAGADIEYAYGGCNEANVKGKATMTLAGADVAHTYGGCNTSGQVDTSEIIVRGDGANTIYGGGQGEKTTVVNANVTVQNGTVAGNIYGGSGYGRVETSNVTVKEANATDKIDIQKSVYGGGYGDSSVVINSNVTIDMKLAIATDESADADLIVEEASAETAADPVSEPKPGDASSGETKTEIVWKNGRENVVSVIHGSVYGGGDMGKVGDGNIKVSTNTADITEKGTTNVLVKNGYIVRSVFGGGSGTPGKDMAYTPYMGTVFGTCKVNVQGGFVKESIYGCGHQSRVYAPEVENAKAAEVNITETTKEAESVFKAESAGSIIIGTSVFGGGNKGDGNNQNASVYTVIGDTVVNITGVKGKETSTGIYFLSEKKGGVYGDGNLCLVNGERTVNLTDFNYGSENKGLLKTFYSLQRADVVKLENSRVVLRGAKDLVDETADDTEYAINRVGQLNMEKSSALKLTTVVNLLGGLTSDQNTTTTYIDRGNNGENSYTYRGGDVSKDVLKDEQISEYRNAYLHFLNKGGSESNNYTSFNVVCVANGSYLEIKKSDTEYGAVKGLFTLELLHANPGEGGGFVYADIGTTEEGSGSTGDFICTTLNEETREANADDKYMAVKDNVGGYMNFRDGETGETGGSGSDGETAKGDYTYYYWYIKGGKYTYNTNLKGYIGTSETVFESAVNLMTLEENHHYILNSISGLELSDEPNSSKYFYKDRFVDHWKEEYNNQDKYAIELRVVPGGTGENLKTESIGFLSYGKYGENGEERWGINKAVGTAGELNSGSVITGSGDDNADVDILKENDIYEVLSGTTGLSLQFILHKGTAVTTEFKDVPITLTFDVLKGSEDGYVPGNTGDNAHLTVNTFTSITRLVPTQAAFIGSGRLYAGVTSAIPVQITKNSAFTAQFVTKFVPSAFNTNDLQIKETLTTDSSELYLLDEESGIGFTATEDQNGLKLTYATEGSLASYTLGKTDNGGYQVTYTDKENQSQMKQLTLVNANKRSAGVNLPSGTVITLVAQIDDHAPTYWYYHVENEAEEIALNEFVRMGQTGETAQRYSFENASNGKISNVSSNRVTESLTFVFDFSNVPGATTHYAEEQAQIVGGSLRLKHQTTINSIQNADIMDYVSTSSLVDEQGNAVTTHTREYPAVSETFKVSKESNGLDKFEVTLAEEREYFTKDTYQVNITIEEDKDFINTQYEEREYAVVLQQVKNGANGEVVIPFPEGTMFQYNGENIIAGNQNLSAIIPVKKAGSHEVEMETTLEGFDVGEVHLKATLYSSSVASYYNNIDTDVYDMMTFDVTERTEAALKIETVDEGSDGASDESTGESIEKQIFAGGETVTLNIRSISPEGQGGQAAANTSGKVQNGAGGTDASAGTQNGSGGTDASAGTQNGSDGTDTSAGAQSGAGGTNALPDTQTGTVAIYKYVRKSNTQNPIAFYSKTPLDEVFKNAAASFAADGNGTKWTASIKSNASPGTYRLEFQYEDKTEYWDFVVKE